MTERYPTYYERFRCIADRCEDTCCAGWEIDIDDASYEAYMRVEGELGERLRACIRAYDDGDTDDGLYEEVYAGHGFILTADKRCPFLDEDNLCILYRELGEASLCEVCTHTPRNYLEYGGMREISISASCPEAARLIYRSPEPMTFTERTVSGEALIGADGASTGPEEDEDEAELAIFLKNVRDEAITLLQDRSRPLNERTERFLAHAARVQEAINRWETEEVPLPETIPADAVKDDGSPAAGAETADNGDGADAYRQFLVRMDIYSGLASIGPAWAERITRMYERFCDEAVDGRAAYLEATESLMRMMEDAGRLYEYEHLLVYYAFLLLNRCIDDYDYLTKARLVVMSCEMGRDMDADVLAEKGTFDVTDREANARIYAREVEHAEENLADLYEEILFL